MRRVFYSICHAGLLALAYFGSDPYRIYLLVFRPSHRSGISSAEDEELIFIRRLRAYAEQIIHIVHLFYLVGACDEPGIDDLGIQLLIPLRKSLYLFCTRVLKIERWLMGHQEPDLFLCPAPADIVLVVVDVHFTGMFDPVVEKPRIRRVLHDRHAYFLCSHLCLLFGHSGDQSDRIVDLCKVGKYAGQYNAQGKHHCHLYDYADFPVASLLWPHALILPLFCLRKQNYRF